MEEFKKIFKILRAKKLFSKPKKKELFIYDENTFRSGYADFFHKNDCFIFDTRYKKLYFFLYIKAIFKKIIFFSKERIFQLYTIEVIRVVDPKYIICFSHYTLIFWDLKKYFKNITFIICQHHISLGYNGKYHLNPILMAKERYKNKKKIDHVFLWGKGMIEGFKECLDGNFYQSGSIKNNRYKNLKIENNKDLIFMSQYQNWLNSSQIQIPLEDGTSVLKYDFNFNERKIVLNILHEYCLSHNLNLVIAPRQYHQKDFNEEKEYYNKILNGKKFIFLSRTKQFQVYEEFNKYKYFAVIDCSTGYEAMARGRRVAHLNVVYDLSGVSGGKNHRFGWPCNFDLKGPFWTNKASKTEIFRCLDFIFQTKDEDWVEIKKKYIDPIIIYDEGNKAFKNNLKKIGLKVK